MSRAGPPGEDWIVCLSRTRRVVDGFVGCPKRDGQPMPIAVCEACHHLAWRRDERMRPAQCSTEPEGSFS
jgi:hypothetical protein